MVYFVFVLPINTAATARRPKRGAAGEQAGPEPETELELLGQIRDLLADRSAARRSTGTGAHRRASPGLRLSPSAAAAPS